MNRYRLADLEVKQREMLQQERQLLAEMYGQGTDSPAQPDKQLQVIVETPSEELKTSVDKPREHLREGRYEVHMFEESKLASVRESDEEIPHTKVALPQTDSCLENPYEGKPAEELRDEIQMLNQKIKLTESNIAQIQTELNKAIPTRAAAMDAAAGLDAESMRQVTSQSSPTTEVRLVCSAIMTLFDYSTSWPSMKKMLASPEFLDRLKSLDLDSLPEKAVKKVRREYISKKTFKINEMRKQSFALVNLCCWVTNVDSYFKARSAH